MSQSTGGVRERAAAVGERGRSLAVAAVAAAPEPRTRTVRLAAASAAVAGLGPLTATRVALNAPVVLPSAASAAWLDAAATAAVLGPAAGATLLGATADEAWARTGLILVGTFGFLSAVSTAFALPTVGAVVVGSWLTLVGRAGAVDRPATHWDVAGGLVAAALLGGLTLSLFGAVGVRPAALRPAGSTLALVGMAATPLAFRPRPSAFAVGGLAAAAAFHLTGAAPFVSGAVVLVAGGVVGASAPLLAAAIGGLAATVAEGAAGRRVAPAAAGLLLLAAGVPSSIPRALGAALAAAFVAATIAGGGTSA
ncbi:MULTISPECIES: phosphate ABC transporter permease [Halorussus]|uniref:phosphate ABC transporter permease n=1 Tax=Halorussus TaxID=1070314 RepID=UPI000E20D39A|nr:MULTISPECIES: phosphate ABC transporter permease [Halorussus]NHN61592.1 phosphate ABC transporter permease [Halorussus sp. JP-T4]